VLCGHDGRRGYLHHLAVSKRHRQLGIGRQLVSACLAKLRKADVSKMQHLSFRQQHSRPEVLAAHWMEFADGKFN